MILSICKALYSYEANNPDELSFKEDDILFITDNYSNTEWWQANLKIPGSDELISGIIPSNYIQDVKNLLENDLFRTNKRHES